MGQQSSNGKTACTPEDALSSNIYDFPSYIH